MKLLSLDIPEDPKDLARWLERHLLGPDLARLVTEMSVLQAAPAATGQTVDQVLGTWLPRVLKEGLAILPPDMLRQLLLRPRLLPELQELILLKGGRYWDHVSKPGAGDATESGLDDLVERGRHRLAQHLESDGSKAAPSTLPFPPLAKGGPGGVPAHQPRQVLPFTAKPAWHRRPWVVSLATAASVMAAVFLWQMTQTSPAPAAWGWNKPGAMPGGVSAGEYFNALADGAAEWFNKRPEDAGGLAKRIGDLRQGCAALIFAEHRPLPPGDREWLVEKCRAWAAKLDQQRTALEAGAALEEIRQQADQTVTNLIAALRARARPILTTEAQRAQRRVVDKGLGGLNRGNLSA
jgi:hypothetical protein